MCPHFKVSYEIEESHARRGWRRQTVRLLLIYISLVQQLLFFSLNDDLASVSRSYKIIFYFMSSDPDFLGHITIFF